MYQLNTADIRLISQPVMDIRLKIDVYNDITGEHLDQLECGLVNGTSSISSESDVRRTFSITAVPVNNSRLAVSKDGILWLNRYFIIQVGIYDMVSGKWNWYEQGKYIISSTSSNYDATTNEITIDCSDFTAKLDGTKNGQLGALTISYPAYEEDEVTGEVIKYNLIRDAVITTLTQMGGITDYEVDDIGEYKAMPDYNPDYLKYREQNPLWNVIPCDQEFSAGCSVLSIITTFRDLYPNYESYFDEKGVFILKMIPSCYEDDIVFDSSFFKKIYISENTSIDMTEVRNICEVWGDVIDADYYTESCTYASNCYSCTIDGYDEKYYNGDVVAVKVPSANMAGATLNINGYGAILILDEYTDEAVEADAVSASQVYVFKITRKLIDSDYVYYAYLLGQWEPHGLSVLTDGTVSSEWYTTQNGGKVRKYSLEYFKAVYNCETVEFTIIPDSPFTVQEIGEVLDVKSGSEYDNITSDSLAVARAEYENWKNCRLTDSITISTKICPFADVNIKVEYQRTDSDVPLQYIVKSISHDFSAATTSWTLMRFYPLYSDQT
jgi:hypothetical protein